MCQNLIYPEALSAGDTVGLIATSTPIDEAGTELPDRAKDRLSEMGFSIIEAPNCRSRHGHTAGTVRERVSALHQFFEDDQIDGILSFWGGYNTHQLLEYLDWDLIRENPKPIIGYSDITCLTNVITDRTGIVTYQGPAGITFAKPIFYDYSANWFRKVVMGGGTELTYEPSEKCSDNVWYERDDQKMVEKVTPDWEAFQPGVAEGRIIGGNLGTLLLLAGTQYWPEFEGRIFFVEEDEAESAATIDRMFTQARQIGIFDKISGMVVGRLPESVRGTGGSMEMILSRSLEGYDFPVMTKLDFGHTDPRFTFPLGVRCRLNSSAKKLTLVERWIK